MSFFTELKRRKVYQVAVIYTAAAWGLLQAADVIFTRLGLPDWSVTFLFALEVVGFPLALILSWIFDIKAGGMVRTGAAPGSAPESAREARRRESLAVLPFNNMSDDASLEHLADGLVEDLITRLQGHVGIPVNSRNSCFVYKGQAVDVVKVAEELGAAYVVEGSVRVQGDTARITAQLIDAASDHHVWAEKFDRPLGDIFSLQDELVEAMAEAITGHLSDEGVSGSPASDAPPAEAPAADQPVGIHKGWVATATVLVLGLAGVLTWSLEQRGDERWAREVALPEIEQLVEADDVFEAFARIQELEAVLPSDPLLLKLRNAVSITSTIHTQPSGVQVSYRADGVADAEWIPLGISPLEDLRLPTGHLQLRFEGEGIVTTHRMVRNPTGLLHNFDASPASRVFFPEGVFKLATTDEGREGMAFVEPWSARIALPHSRIEPAAFVPAYFIDIHEVTNAEYQSFVDAGGYGESRYWADLDFGGAEWPGAVATFTDQTSQPGPAGWEMGRFRPGDEQLPVTGVSWFEAAAYCRFAGKELPTFYHWYRAALDYMELVAPVAPAVIRQSNFAGKGLAPVGQYPAISFYGLKDMGGNAREWLANADADMRWIAGGAWNQVPYMFLDEEFEAPATRGPTNGFRCMTNADGERTPEPLTVATDLRGGPDPRAIEPVDDETYAIYRDQFGYLKRDLVSQLLSTEQMAYWRQEKVRIDSPYSADGMEVLLLIPDNATSPMQALVMMPGSDAFFSGATLKGYDWADYEPSLAVVLQSGRALVLPVWDGAFGRGLRLSSSPDEQEWREFTRSRGLRWRQDLGATLDYLETRDDIDSSGIGYLGISAGASAPLAMLAVEPRVKTAVLVAGGLTGLDDHPLVQPANHAPRITIPVLMINGRYDQNFPLDSRQQPLFDLLGAEGDRKKHAIYDAGHIGYPVSQQRREITGWLDKWL
jgi:TolB-like protein/dienelactone hydrolase